MVPAGMCGRYSLGVTGHEGCGKLVHVTACAAGQAAWLSLSPRIVHIFLCLDIFPRYYDILMYLPTIPKTLNKYSFCGTHISF